MGFFASVKYKALERERISVGYVVCQMISDSGGGLLWAGVRLQFSIRRHLMEVIV